MQVEYVAHSGNDLLVVDAARASFGKQSQWEVVGEYGVGSPNSDTAVMFPVYGLSDKDKKLLDYLAREKHILPFRHPQITLRCKAPIFLARQLGKHQVGMSWSEESRRYITTEPEFFWPDKWRKKADNVKQGSSDETASYDGLYIAGATTFSVEEMADMTKQMYNEMLAAGIAPEQARMVLPQNMMTTWVWTGSLLSFYQMYKLRAEAHAQREAQQFASMVKDTVRPLYPEAWDSLERHV